LASCCRLRNEIADNTFSYSLGAGGVSTGSINVITMNINRMLQKGLDIRTEVKKIHQYQMAYHAIIKGYYDAGLLPAYSAGFISLEKQFLTIGVNGVVEAAEYNDIPIRDSKAYKAFIDSILQPIFEENKEAKATYGVMFNTEFVPAENLGVKNARWDQEDGLKVNRTCYNSYFYIVEDEATNAIDKFIMHGEKYVKYLDGGSALHLNLNEHLDYNQYLQLLKVAAINKTNYWTVNVKNTICNECGHVDKSTHDKCPICGSYDIDYATRVIGYLKRVKSFSSSRQKEAKKRAYHEIS
jgi:ribonucleoside-triphosphate reductase